MSISSEITRISNAKTAIAESITNKGVTVPSGTKIDGMAALIDSIQTGGSGTAVQPSKALTVTSNGTTTITPDAPYDAIKQVDLTVNVASGGSGAEPATLTITSQTYTGNMYGMFVFVNSEGHLEYLSHVYSPFTFPITIETVLGGFVSVVSNDFPGIPAYMNHIGCEAYIYTRTHYILVTNPQASVEMYNSD